MSARIPPQGSTIECEFAFAIERFLYRMHCREHRALPRLAGTGQMPTLLDFRFREETFTECLVADAATRFPNIVTQAFTPPRESSVSGADWLCRIQTQTLTVALLIQAKRPRAAIHNRFGPWEFDLDSAARPATTTRPARVQWHQRDTLIRHAQTLHALPLYGFYAPDCSTHTCAAVRWQCRPTPNHAFGSLHLVPANSIAQDPFTPGSPMPGYTLSALLCCPNLLQGVMGESGVEGGMPLTEEDIILFVQRRAGEGEAPRVVTFLDFTGDRLR